MNTKGNDNNLLLQANYTKKQHFFVKITIRSMNYREAVFHFLLEYHFFYTKFSDRHPLFSL